MYTNYNDSSLKCEKLIHQDIYTIQSHKEFGKDQCNLLIYCCALNQLMEKERKIQLYPQEFREMP